MRSRFLCELYLCRVSSPRVLLRFTHPGSTALDYSSPYLLCILFACVFNGKAYCSLISPCTIFLRCLLSPHITYDVPHSSLAPHVPLVSPCLVRHSVPPFFHLFRRTYRPTPSCFLITHLALHLLSALCFLHFPSRLHKHVCHASLPFLPAPFLSCFITAYNSPSSTISNCSSCTYIPFPFTSCHNCHRLTSPSSS